MIEFKWSKVHRPDQTPIIRDVEIEDLVEELLRDYKPKLLEHPMPVNPEHFAETYMGIDIEYQGRKCCMNLLIRFETKQLWWRT